MPILNYTTSVPVEKSIAAITALLVRKGARTIHQEYAEDGRVKGIAFVMPVGGWPVRFVLPNQPEGVFKVMLKEAPWNYRRAGSKQDYEARMREQADRVSWRIVKDWVEAQMALIESGQAEVGQVFMPYAEHENGRTMYQLWTENNQKRLAAGGAE